MSIGPWGSGSFGTGVFSATPFYNSSSLIDAVLRDSGHSNPTTEAAKRLVVLSALNNRYALVSTSQHWSWLYQEVDMLLKEPYETGTINLTALSQAVVGVGTGFDVNILPNNVLSIPTRNETYVIASIETSEALTLEGQYAGETDTLIPLKVIKPYYVMPTDCESMQSVIVDGVGELIPIGTQEMARMKQHETGKTGAPRWFTEVGRRQSDGLRLMEVYPAPDKNYTARLHYGVNIMKLEDSATNYPLIPDRHRAVLYFGALADMFYYLRDNVSGDRNEALFMAALMNMRNDKQLTDSKIQFQPARNYRNRNRRTRKRSMTASQFASEE